MKIREFGFHIGEGTPGKRDLITDVPGVRVGHTTIDTDRNKTGVTVIIPCDGFVFGKKPVAASFVLNGYGKTVGTVQIDELGTLETPIALTNTLNVGIVSDALVEYTLKEGKSNGVRIRSVNAVVGETNDSNINHIEDRAVTREDVFAALSSASEEFEQGAVGAGRGTCCFDLKGGIGSASRCIRFDGHTYTIGALVQSNYGSLEDLMICGTPVGREIAKQQKAQGTEDVGSIMVVIGTDLPLSARQLRRVLKRAAVGLVRCGSYMGHGSGDVFLGFTNGNYMGSDGKHPIELKCMPEDRMNSVFRPAAAAVEEAVLNSMINAVQTTGLDGTVYHSLREYL